MAKAVVTWLKVKELQGRTRRDKNPGVWEGEEGDNNKELPAHKQAAFIMEVAANSLITMEGKDSRPKRVKNILQAAARLLKMLGKDGGWTR